MGGTLRNPETRTRLLEAAERLIELNGFTATSVDAILVEASSSKGAFFHHFSCKRDLDQTLVAVGDADLGMLHEGLRRIGHPVFGFSDVRGWRKDGEAQPGLSPRSRWTIPRLRPFDPYPLTTKAAHP